MQFRPKNIGGDTENILEDLNSSRWTNQDFTDLVSQNSSRLDMIYYDHEVSNDNSSSNRKVSESMYETTSTASKLKHGAKTSRKKHIEPSIDELKFNDFMNNYDGSKQTSAPQN